MSVWTQPGCRVSRVKSVSYTHLDVYKRQPLKTSERLPSGRRALRPPRRTVWEKGRPVTNLRERPNHRIGNQEQMSRIGKQPITLPSGVDVSRQNGSVSVKGPKGTLVQSISPLLEVGVEEGVLTVSRANDTKEARAQHGLVRTLISNMVTGVTEGYVKQLDISGVGYRAQLQGSNLQLALGFSHPVIVTPREGITFEVGVDTNTRSPFIKISGIDKQLVGQTAAEIRSLKKPEPYKGKGIRYHGETIRRKAGKSGKAGGKGKK